MSKYIKNWFSNMLPFDEPMKYQGLTFPAVENFFQAMKCNKDDILMREKISKATPFESKRLGKKVSLRKDWQVIKLNVMEFALNYKFQEGTSWRRKLNETTGEIVETNNWHDNYWGNCICDRCKHIYGQNHLGKLLMKIRDNLEVELQLY